MTEAGKNRNMTETGLIRVRRAEFSRRSFVGGAAAFGALALGSPATARQEQPIIEPIGGTQTGQGQNQVPITLPEEQTVGEIEQMAALSSGEYFATSGHNLTEPFLAAWRKAGGQVVLGIPLSEPRFVEDTGLIEQMFEGVTLAQNPIDEGTASIRGVPVGDATANGFSSAASRRSVNGCAGGEGSCRFFPETGQTVSGLFALFWNNRGGEAIFGRPLSEPEKRGGTTTQVFENAILNLSTGDGTITAERIGAEIVAEQGLASNPAFLPAPPTLGESTLVSASDGLRLRTGPSTDSETEVLLPENAEFIAVRGATGAWIPGYADGYSGWVASEWLVAPQELPQVAVGGEWDTSVWQGATLSEANIRAEPTTESEIVATVPFGHPVIAVDWVKGEKVDLLDIWAELEDGTYLYEPNVGRAGPVEPTPVPGDAPTQGKWIDCNLTQQLLIAYEGRTPVRIAVQTTGKPGWETPEGFYTIGFRVANETMESGAIGAEEFYRLENVLFTQYFTDRGHALHFAWWKSPETIGRPGSHGCLNLLLEDAEFFWNWAGIGTPVYSHY